MSLEFLRRSDRAIIPTRNNSGDAGYDIYACSDNDVDAITIKPFERVLVRTDISVKIPYGYYGRIAPRSGLALKFGIDVLAGVVDFGYEGEVGVILINLGSKDFKFKHSDRIAQLVVTKIYVDGDASTRGEKGFGSSDV